MPGARGEATIQAGDREVQVLFTYRALADAETRLHRKIIDVMRDMMENETFSVTDTVTMLCVGMEAARRDAHTGGRAIGMTEAFDVLDLAGITTVLTAISEAMAPVLTYSA
jgi:hypothetical protein